jgi:hypothetical protein
MDSAEIMELRLVAMQLEKWADESVKGGWSTHQVEPMREYAKRIWVFIGKNMDKPF